MTPSKAELRRRLDTDVTKRDFAGLSRYYEHLFIKHGYRTIEGTASYTEEELKRWRQNSTPDELERQYGEMGGCHQEPDEVAIHLRLTYIAPGNDGLDLHYFVCGKEQVRQILGSEEFANLENANPDDLDRGDLAKMREFVEFLQQFSSFDEHGKPRPRPAISSPVPTTPLWPTSTRPKPEPGLYAKNSATKAELNARIDADLTKRDLAGLTRYYDHWLIAEGHRGEDLERLRQNAYSQSEITRRLDEANCLDPDVMAKYLRSMADTKALSLFDRAKGLQGHLGLQYFRCGKEQVRQILGNKHLAGHRDLDRMKEYYEFLQQFSSFE